MLDIFNIVDLVFHVIFLAGLFYRWKQHAVPSYKYLAGAVGAFALSDVVTILLSLVTTSPWAYMIPTLLNLGGGLICIMVVLRLLLSWTGSMQGASHTGLNTGALGRSSKLCRVLMIAYPILTAGTAAMYILSAAGLSFANLIGKLVGVAYAIFLLVQMALEIWLWMSCKQGEGTIRRKRSQVGRLALLTACSALATLLSGFSSIAQAIFWWIWSIIILWPGALVGYEEVPYSESIYGEPTGRRKAEDIRGTSMSHSTGFPRSGYEGKVQMPPPSHLPPPNSHHTQVAFPQPEGSSSIGSFHS
ncbi:MAG: hypothetical protein DHS80DRAFT_23101 [Piptocephalis tieghemiana]|nr:MAG: hypothetical protein DHS80DRAFT_23101 [Piptocephalis tieghemiana]